MSRPTVAERPNAKDCKSHSEDRSKIGDLLSAMMGQDANNECVERRQICCISEDVPVPANERETE